MSYLPASDDARATHLAARWPMPFYVLGGIPPELPGLRRARAGLLRGVTVVGGPFPTRAAADVFVLNYLPAQHHHAETMLGIDLPLERYTVSTGEDIVAAICAALDLPDPGER